MSAYVPFIFPHCMDVILVNSPIHDYSRYGRFKTSYSTPVGLLFLATVAKQAGFSVSILDAEQDQLTPSEIADHINGKRPRFVGFNAFSVNFAVVQRISHLIREQSEIIVGGPHVSAMKLEHLQEAIPNARWFVKGDGETKLLEILKGTDPTTIPGVYFRSASAFETSSPSFFEEDLDELPIPDRSLLAAEPYSQHGLRCADISISRGCIFTCAFCSGSCKSSGSTYRRRHPSLVYKEIQQLVENGIQAIEIVDDLPFKNNKDLLEFLELLEGTSINWELNLPALYLKGLSSLEFARMSSCGVRRISFGIESGSHELRKRMGKNVTDDELSRIVTQLSDNGISAKGYFVIGFPGETRPQVEATVQLATSLYLQTTDSNSPFRPRMFVYKPFPKTPLWNELLASGYAERDLLRYSDFDIDIEYFRKHAWSASMQFSDIPVHQLQETINRFYNSIQSNGSE